MRVLVIIGVLLQCTFAQCQTWPLAYTELTEAAADDYFLIEDTSDSGTTKYIKRENVPIVTSVNGEINDVVLAADDIDPTIILTADIDTEAELEAIVGVDFWVSGDYLLTPAGDATTPGISIGATTEGLYQGAGAINVVANDVVSWSMSSALISGITSKAGAIKNATASATNPTLLPNKSNTTSGIGQNLPNNVSIIAAGGEGLRVTNALSVLMPEVYNDTDASAANVYIDATGQLYRSTSSRKIKTLINYNVPTSDALDFKPATYVSKTTGRQHTGFIAEDLAPIYTNGDKDLPGIDTNAIVAALTVTVQNHEKRIFFIEFVLTLVVLTALSCYFLRKR